MTDTATLQARLTDAETALHKLMTGSMEASTSFDGFTTSWSKTNIGDLRAYIGQLKSELGLSSARKRGLGRVLF